MSKKKKISIITPSFNQGHFLEQTIDSVLSQNYPNLEYIVIDGGSTDESLQIIKKHEKHLKFWVGEMDGRKTVAINKGLTECTSKIVNWLDSDNCNASDTVNSLNVYSHQFCHYVFLSSSIIFDVETDQKKEQQINLMTVDAESPNFELLISNVWTNFWPDWICTELPTLDMKDELEHPISLFLEEKWYVVFSKAWKSGLYHKI